MIQVLSVLVLLFSGWQSPQLPQHHPLSDEYRKEWQEAYRRWKPGLKVAAEIKRLNERIRELNAAHSRGEITLKALSVELQRFEIQRHLILCLALAAAPRDEVPALVVVLVNSREIMKVFPSGQLPEDPLKPNHVYETERGSKRRVRYLTTYRWGDGERFAVFARELE